MVAAAEAIFRYDGELVLQVAVRGWPAEAIEDARRFYPGPPDRRMISGRVILTGEVQIEEDTFSDAGYDQVSARLGLWRRLIGAPLLKDGAPIGAIVLAWHDPGATPQSQVDLLKTFADQAVIAIQNARLFNETKDALEQQIASAEVLQVISSSVADTQPVFDKILDSCRRLFAGDGLVIQLIGEDGRLHLGAYNGRWREQTERAYPVALVGSAAERAIREGRVLQYSNILPDSNDVPVFGSHGSQLGPSLMSSSGPLGT